MHKMLTFVLDSLTLDPVLLTASRSLYPFCEIWENIRTAHTAYMTALHTTTHLQIT
jgi:hypothetical protein